MCWSTLSKNCFNKHILSYVLLILNTFMKAKCVQNVNEVWGMAWHHPFVISWSKYRLGMLHLQCILGSRDKLEFPPFFKGLWQSVPLHNPDGYRLGLCKETMKESSNGPVTRYVKLWVAHAPGMPGTFPRHLIQRKPLVSDPGMYHATCVTHMSWCMPGSLIRGGGENVPGIPGARAIHNFTYLVRGQYLRVSQSSPV